MKPSGIGGQAVLEGIMMRNRDRYAVAVRKPDGTIAVDFHMDHVPKWQETVHKIPIVRGVVSFVLSLVVGMKTLTYSASFFEDEEPGKAEKKERKAGEKAGEEEQAAETAKAGEENAGEEEQAAETAKAGEEKAGGEEQAAGTANAGEEDRAGETHIAETQAEAQAAEESNRNAGASEAVGQDAAGETDGKRTPENQTAGEEAAAFSSVSSVVSEGEKGEAFTPLEMGLTVVLAIVLAIGIFMLLPYGLSLLFRRFVTNVTLLSLIEGVIRLAIFLAYVWAISLMEDIRRTYMYHGSEHKCINCIESGLPLTVENVRSSSRFHKRCGTSFLLIVMVISIVVFSLIRTDSVIMRLVYRLLLIPVVAGISYEFLQWAGRSDNAVLNILSAPGLCLQRLTTKEPTDDMIEVAIAAVERVFDWQAFLDGKDADECFPPKKAVKKKVVKTKITDDSLTSEEMPVGIEKAEDSSGSAELSSDAEKAKDASAEMPVRTEKAEDAEELPARTEKAKDASAEMPENREGGRC